VKEILFSAVAAALVLVIQTTSFGFLLPSAYKPDLFLVLVFWASLRLPFLVGVALAFVGGMCVDLLSGSPLGLFAVIYCSTFVTCGYLNTVFQIDTPGRQAATTFGAAVACAAVVLLGRALTGPMAIGWNSLQWVLLKTFCTTVSSLALFPLMDRARTAYTSLTGIR
jgi:rod shape-determining protein MreD